jgi:hypothetical protein
MPNKPDNLPIPDLPIQAAKPGDPPLAAPALDALAMQAKFAIPPAKIPPGTQVIDARMGKAFTVVQIGRNGTVPVYQVQDEQGNLSVRNQDEFDEATGQK